MTNPNLTLAHPAGPAAAHPLAAPVYPTTQLGEAAGLPPAGPTAGRTRAADGDGYQETPGLRASARTDPGVLFQRPAGSTAEARAIVNDIRLLANKELGFWGRNAVKLTAPTLLGLFVGIRARNASAARISGALAPRLHDLQAIIAQVEAVPAKQRTPAQKKLIKESRHVLAKFSPTGKDHLGEVAKVWGWMTLGVTVGAAIGLVVGGVALGLAMLLGDPGPFGIFGIVGGSPMSLGFSCGSGSNRTPTYRGGDELSLEAPAPDGYQPLKKSTVAW